ncbi:MAG: aldo/keto reductase [Rikenellaceae bacterium]
MECFTMSILRENYILYNGVRIPKTGIKREFDNCEIAPMANQIAFHAGRTQEEYVAFCNRHNILIEAYSPLATGRALSNKLLNEVASSYEVSVAQLLIRFALQRGTLPLPKTTTYKRMVENTKVDHFEISGNDMEILNILSIPSSWLILRPSPETHPAPL